MGKLDLDLFNKEQWPFNYDGDCLDLGEWLYQTWKYDNSGELYDARVDEQIEKELEEYGELQEEYEPLYEYDY